MLVALTADLGDVVEVEAGGQDGEFDLTLERFINGGTPNHFDIVAELLHELRHIVHLVHAELVALLATRIATEGDVEEDLLGVGDVVIVEQR